MQQQQQQQQQGNGGHSDFVAAVLITFDPSADAGLREQAQAYCNAIASSEDGWQLCLAKLNEVALNRGSDHVKFWCLMVIENIADKRYHTMSQESKDVLRRSLMLFVRDVIPAVPQPGHIKNKLCAIIVRIVKHDYPAAWPTFFSSVALSRTRACPRLRCCDSTRC